MLDKLQTVTSGLNHGTLFVEDRNDKVSNSEAINTIYGEIIPFDSKDKTPSLV
jgi:hypothetical protein